ncbi:hypothetical protein BJY52DRAFT_1175085 [Lactarius psammicola]|nr:hypothetical protein BJY52DRAFT_1175085 [Lactarius psammicola]
MVNRSSGDQLQKDARSWISPPDPSKNHVVLRGFHSRESAMWFTRGRTFETWNLQGGLLWIHGIPGSGKSVLCSSIIEQATALRNEGLGLVAYYYFDFGETEKQNARGLLSSLVVQLCAKSDIFSDILFDLYSKHDAGLRLPGDDALTQCLKNMLKRPGQAPIYIIVDALDECPNSFGAPSPRELVLGLIEDLVQLHLPNLRICLTSRYEDDIQEALEPLVSHSVSLHDEAGQKQDIIDYISSAVRSDKKMRWWGAEDRQLVIDTLTQRADGMFKWVSCQIEWLRGCFPPDIRHALEELPKTLDATYERTLLGIEEAKREYACRLFQCLAVSFRPLCVEELAEVLAIRRDAGEDSQYRTGTGWRPTNAQQAVLSACSSLITIVNVDGSEVVQFSHFSVKEFLLSSRLANAAEHLSRYHILPHFAHAVLAHSCLSVLLNLGDQVDKSAVDKRPFAIYAARYWVNHGKFEGVSSSIQDLMERLFDADRPHFATWVWIFDVERPWKGFMATMHPAQPGAGPLYYAALCGFRDLVEHLTLTHPTDVNARGGNYGTPLNAAFVKGEVEIARILLKNGANINTLDDVGTSSLHRAAEFGHSAVVKLLLERQADINVLTLGDLAETPLHSAASAGELDVCRLLLKYGAEVVEIPVRARY